MVSIYRGFGRTKEQVYFQNFIYNILFLVFVLIIAILNLPFISVFYSYLAAQILTFMALVFYSYRFRLFEIGFAFNMNVGKDLLLFSLPLLISSILVFVLNWTDTLMLGYYKSADVVGLYNAASPLAKLIPIVLSSAGFIYMPVASSLYAKGKIKEMGRTYQMLTKWIFLLTLPIFSIMFLFPEATIYFLFGAQYLPASQTLRILSLGFIFHTFLGLNGLSLVVIKESTSLLFASTVSATANVVLNILLIPFYGIEGAAIASAASYFMGNILITLQLYKKTRIHPFSWNYVKPLVISFILLILVQKIIGQNISIWHALAILILFLVIYFLLVLLSKSVDKEDVELFLAVEEKLGVDLEIIKRILRRFV
jgi:O-antigen/teichoic acid export membrane protein